MDENEMTYEGITYIAVGGVCLDCAFINKKIECEKFAPCIPENRKDGRSIIWVKKEEKK